LTNCEKGRTGRNVKAVKGRYSWGRKSQGFRDKVKKKFKGTPNVAKTAAQGLKEKNLIDDSKKGPRDSLKVCQQIKKKRCRGKGTKQRGVRREREELGNILNVVSKGARVRMEREEISKKV